MSDIVEHLPVRPNINSSYQKSSKPRVISDQGRSSLLDNSRDPDIQKFINKKKTDALELESTPTNEENISNTTNTKKKSDGISWVVIALAIVIIILIVIVIYYVLKYNGNLNEDIIPASVIKPTNINSINSKQMYMPLPLVKPNEPTQKELDSVLNRLTTIPEETEEELSVNNPSIIKISDVDSDSELEIPEKPISKPISKPVEMPVKLVEKPVVTTSEEPPINIDADNASNFLLDESFGEDSEDIDPELDEKFIKQTNL